VGPRDLKEEVVGGQSHDKQLLKRQGLGSLRIVGGGGGGVKEDHEEWLGKLRGGVGSKEAGRFFVGYIGSEQNELTK